MNPMERRSICGAWVRGRHRADYKRASQQWLVFRVLNLASRAVLISLLLSLLFSLRCCSGVILYILLCGFPPFYHESTAALYKQIKKGEFDFPAPYWSNISESAKDLVRKLLTVDPAKRYTAKQVLEHPWISGSTASSKPLDGDYNKRLKMLQARRRLKKGVQMIIAINKVTNTAQRTDRQCTRRNRHCGSSHAHCAPD